MIDNVLKEYKKWKESKELVFPCNECKTGWGSADSNGVVTCHESCKKFEEWVDNIKLGGSINGTGYNALL